MTAPLFLVDPGALDGLGVDDVVELTGSEAHHAATVMRLRVDEEVLVADRGGARVCTAAASVASDLVSLRVTRRMDEPAPSLRLVLVQSLAKDGRDEDAVEAATELGVDGVIPWQADRSIVRWKGAKVDKGRRKWVNVIERAAKQSRRGRWPGLGELVTTTGLAERCHAKGVTPFVLHEDATTPLAGVELPDAGEILLIVGPEGGISPHEMGLLTDAGARSVRLGPHVLRASTAGPAAVATISTRGRWGWA
ncbi:16S rRNA (uracil(1498)-N(3))-methyltransferase [Janibacter cremeus]|uniref:Ribosomal RNA small subunit methyltransferase E n=1 Tax=Janibacter cremeus TaxID=1285192 RepID=A0A852VYY4_9MICO|nr:16S rRNA (uracil1498-N3)-methyltransferase [Janibacter cremeus]